MLSGRCCLGGGYPESGARITGRATAIAATEEPDPVTEDMLTERAGQLERYQWFVRAHLEDPSGSLATSGARTEEQAAARTRKK